MEVSSVAPYELLRVEGGSASIRVLGDVGEGARLRAEGGGAEIIVDGYVHADASLQAQGGGAKIVIKGGKHGTARVKASGGGASVSVSAQPRVPDWLKGNQPPPDTSWVEFEETGIFGRLRPPKITTRTKFSATAPPEQQHRVDGKWLTVQKSSRPRESWGT